MDAHIKAGGNLETLRVGTVVLAAGWQPYDATKLTKLGYGLSKDVITNLEMEEMAKKGKSPGPPTAKSPKPWPSFSAPVPGTRSICHIAPTSAAWPP